MKKFIIQIEVNEYGGEEFEDLLKRTLPLSRKELETIKVLHGIPGIATIYDKVNQNEDMYCALDTSDNAESTDLNKIIEKQHKKGKLPRKDI